MLSFLISKIPANFWRSAGRAIIFSIVTLSLIAPGVFPVVAAPIWTVFRISYLTIVPVTPKVKTICIGQKESFTIEVINDISEGVPGASIHIGDKLFTTGPDGVATVVITTHGNEGEITYQYWATKDHYVTSLVSSIKIIYINCQWKIGLNYDEEMMLATNSWVMVGSVEIPGAVFKADSSGHLVLENGGRDLTAHYTGHIHMFNDPILCAVDPPVDGTFPVHFDGTYDEGVLTIQLSADPVSLPMQVNVDCSVRDPGKTIKPWPYYTNYSMDFIGMARFKNLVFTADGGETPFAFKKMMIWPTKKLNFADGRLVVWRVKKP